MELTRKILSRTHWSSAQIREYQEERLRKLIVHCWNTVPLYREKWEGVIDSPSDIQTLEDLSQLPTLTKAEVRERLEEMTTTAPGIESSPARTGGSTGSPVVFRMTPYDEELAWAQMYCGWSWAGYRIGAPFLAVGGQSIGVGLDDNRTLKDWVMNRWVSSGSNITRERVAHMTKAGYFDRIELIYGYPNAIREVCEHLEALGRKPARLKGVVCTAEVMRKEVRDRIRGVLGGVPVLDQYGLNDGGLHACESIDQDGLYVSFHRGILEITDDSGNVIHSPGQQGHAIATCLTNYATPFVRYETGDRLHWLDSGKPSSAGINWQRIGPVDGRTGDVIYLPSGKSISMPGLTLVMRWLDGLHQYQFVQTGPNAVTVKLDYQDRKQPGVDELKSQLRERIADEIDWEIEFSPPLLSSNGKLLIIRNEWLRSQGLQRPVV